MFCTHPPSPLPTLSSRATSSRAWRLCYTWGTSSSPRTTMSTHKSSALHLSKLPLYVTHSQVSHPHTYTLTVTHPHTHTLTSHTSSHTHITHPLHTTALLQTISTHPRPPTCTHTLHTHTLTHSHSHTLTLSHTHTHTRTHRSCLALMHVCWQTP